MDESKQSVTSSDGKTTEEIIKLTLGLEMILKNNDVYYQVIKAMEEYAEYFSQNPKINIKQETTDKLFNAITSNGCREIDEIRFNQAVNEALIIYSKPMEWISVEDRLPKQDRWTSRHYFVLRNGQVEIDQWIVDIKNKAYWYNYSGITHWMPLPETKNKP